MSGDATPAERTAIVNEMDAARAQFRQLLDTAQPTGLQRRSDGTRWTNEQLLFHMLFGYLVVQKLLLLVRVFGRLPPAAGRIFAGCLNAGVRPFNWVNYWGSVAGARVFPARRMARKFDRVIDSLQHRLDRASARELARGMHFPTRWDPFFQPYMTLADIYHYPTQHFDFHRRQLSL